MRMYRYPDTSAGACTLNSTGSSNSGRGLTTVDVSMLEEERKVENKNM